jgi:hypothetical protein
VTTFKDCGEAYVTTHAPGWREKNHEQWKHTLERYVYPMFGDSKRRALVMDWDAFCSAARQDRA